MCSFRRAVSRSSDPTSHAPRSVGEGHGGRRDLKVFDDWGECFPICNVIYRPTAHHVDSAQHGNH